MILLVKYSIHCRLNSHVMVTPLCVQLDSSNALSILSQYDIIVDSSDNVATRSATLCVCVSG